MRTKNLHHFFNASVLAAALAATPALVYSAGLGKVTVLSALGQPLRAEVELIANADELSSMKAQMAAAQAFREAGIEFAPALANIRVSVEKRPNGQAYLKLASDRPLNDPFLDLLLEVSWAQGRLLREYTFLLDPAPEAIAPKPIALNPPADKRDSAVTRAVAPPPQLESRAAPTIVEKAAPPRKKAAPEAGTETSSDGAAATREVRKGDTLSKIAAENKYEGINLDQMLVAFFRGNQDAFSGGNMNRLKAGKILQIPDREAVEAVSQPEARRVVVAQSADFNAYRQKLAAAAGSAEAPREEAAQQSVNGKITAKVEEKIAPAAENKDQLKVSRADPNKDKIAAGRVSALEEEAVAREKALKEANSRLAELEKNVRDLQKLVELKSQNLAELQKQAANAKAPAPVDAKKPDAAAPALAAEAPKPVLTPAVPEKPDAAEKPAEPVTAPLAQSAMQQDSAPVAAKPAEVAKTTDQPAAAPKKPVAPPPAPAPEPGFLDGLMDNPLVLGGGVLVLGLLALLGYRRHQAGKPALTEAAPTTTSASLATNSVFGSTGGRTVDTSSSSLQTDFSQASISAIDADEGVDPVAEADVYMAYGRDAQAEEILLDALKNDPARTAVHAKLLEIYAGRKSVKQFETLASELYAQTGGTGPDWEKASALGLKLDPANPLYAGKAASEPVAPAVVPAPAEPAIVVSSPEKLKDTWAMPGELAQIANAVDKADVSSTVVLDKAAVQAAETAANPVAALDFDLDLDTPKQPQAKPAAPARTEPPQTSEPLDIDLGLDFPPPEGQKAEAAVQGQPDEDALDVEFKLPETGATPARDAGLHFALDLTSSLDESASKAAPAVAKAESGVNKLGFDFNLGSAAIETIEAAPLNIDLSEIDLNLDPGGNSGAAASAGVKADIAHLEPLTEPGEDDQEVATKLELAKAYEEMGDREGARELLQEVAKEGDIEQQQKAREMLAELV